jgi:hypothetical protein
LVGRPRDEYTILSLSAQLESTIGFPHVIPSRLAPTTPSPAGGGRHGGG